MGLMDEFKAEAVGPRRNKMDEIREKLSAEDYNDFIEALDIPSISQMTLVRVLAKRGVHIGHGTISEMRRNWLRNKTFRGTTK